MARRRDKVRLHELVGIAVTARVEAWDADWYVRGFILKAYPDYPDGTATMPWASVQHIEPGPYTTSNDLGNYHMHQLVPLITKEGELYVAPHV